MWRVNTLPTARQTVSLQKMSNSPCSVYACVCSPLRDRSRAWGLIDWNDTNIFGSSSLGTTNSQQSLKSWGTRGGEMPAVCALSRPDSEWPLGLASYTKQADVYPQPIPTCRLLSDIKHFIKNPMARKRYKLTNPRHSSCDTILMNKQLDRAPCIVSKRVTRQRGPARLPVLPSDQIPRSDNYSGNRKQVLLVKRRMC